MTLDSPTHSLWRDRSFWGLTVAQFLGAFNDNLYKQLLMLLFVAVPVVGAFDPDGKQITVDRQSLAQYFFAMPFILFSGYAGYLSDRHSKRTVIVLCKLAEIGVMLLGVVGFLLIGHYGLTTAVLLTLCSVIGLMGTHSAFFGPGKYGSMPEFLPERHLTTANGVMLMTTFLAIILGTSLAGVLKEHLSDHLWIPGLICILIAVAGTASAWVIRPLPAVSPGLRYDISMLAIPRDVRDLLRTDRPLRTALLVSTVFWFAAALVLLAIVALGKRQLEVGDTRTSLLTTIISLGIAGGSVLAGYLARGSRAGLVQRVGGLGMCVTLALMSVPAGEQRHLLGYYGSLVALLLLGGFTGMFAVPLQVFLQARPPDGLKGRTLATMNLLNWIGICASSGVYLVANLVFTKLDWPGSAMFAVCMLAMLPVAIFYKSVVAPDLATEGPSG